MPLRALLSIADTSSAPYLILALRDPAENIRVSIAARDVLNKQIMKTAHPDIMETDYIKNYTAEVKACDDWWSGELLNKHVDPDRKIPYLPVATTTQISSADDTDTVGKLLFQQDADMRENAVASLAASQCSITQLRQAIIFVQAVLLPASKDSP